MSNKSHNNQIDNNSVGFDSNQPKLNKTPKIKTKAKVAKKDTGIPKEIANRMARRIIFTTGIPTISGMGVFIGSYILISRGIADISPTITLVSSASCFLLGLVGLSYGILSASWDIGKGSFLGLENIKPNFQRMKAAFRSNNQ